jgi:hypothetical protein
LVEGITRDLDQARNELQSELSSMSNGGPPLDEEEPKVEEKPVEVPHGDGKPLSVAHGRRAQATQTATNVLPVIRDIQAADDTSLIAI